MKNQCSPPILGFLLRACIVLTCKAVMSIFNRKKLITFTCLEIDMHDSARRELTLLDSITLLGRADRTSIEHLISVTFRTCLDEILHRAHFTWTQNNYADPYPYYG